MTEYWTNRYNTVLFVKPRKWWKNPSSVECKRMTYNFLFHTGVKFRSIISNVLLVKHGLLYLVMKEWMVIDFIRDYTLLKLRILQRMSSIR